MFTKIIRTLSSILPLLLLLQLASAQQRFGAGVRSDGGDALFEEIEHNHQWCCTDATCVDSCDFFNPPMSPSDFLLLPQGTPATSNAMWTYKGQSYTIWEVYVNLDGVAEHFCEELFEYQCRKGGAAVKDPHFQLWNGDWYDYHGECDLVFLKAPRFGKDVGLEVQIRTRMRHRYSYIESAAMKIGDDILEVSSWGEYRLNGVGSADLKGAHLGPFDLVLSSLNEYQHSFDIITEGDQVIQIKTFKDFVDVKLEKVNLEDFASSQGMMGSYPSGSKTARDGITLVEDPNKFGQEWQVRGDEPSLFSVARYPQHPQQCTLPTASAERRRLGETKITRVEAEKACSRLDEKQQREMCIFDVMATGDLDMAAAGDY